MLSKVFVGLVSQNSQSDKFVVVQKYKPDSYRVRFDKTGYETDARFYAITTGSLRDRLKPEIFGVGCLGYATKEYNEKAYARWYGMLSRCYNEKDKFYGNYGGRGVRVCDRWHRFDNFLEDIALIDGYDKKDFNNGLLHLDKDKKQTGKEVKVYSLKTCCFLSGKENSQYREYSAQRAFRAIDPSGEKWYSKSIRQFCREHGLLVTCVAKCLSKKPHCLTHRGWKFEYMGVKNG